MKSFTRELYLQTLGVKESAVVSEISDSDNVFEKGLDSLGVLVIVQRLKAALKVCAADIDFDAIDSQFMYSAPTIKQISDKTLLLEKRNGPSNGDGNAPRQRKMEELLQKYSKDIPSYHLNGQVLKNLTIGIRLN